MTYQSIPHDQAPLMSYEPAPPSYPQTVQPSVAYNMTPINASGKSQYDNTIPLSSLTRSSAPVECPSCSHRGMTDTDYMSGNTTRAWALGTLLLTWSLCCIPYCLSSTKNVTHKCGQCGALLATWHRSGHTEVHLYK